LLHRFVVSTPLRAEDTRKPVLSKEHRDHVSEVEWMRRGNVTGFIPNSHEGEIGVGFLTRLLRQAGVTREEWLGEA
jgi:hypothetical protein